MREKKTGPDNRMRENKAPSFSRGGDGEGLSELTLKPDSRFEYGQTVRIKKAGLIAESDTD